MGSNPKIYFTIIFLLKSASGGTFLYGIALGWSSPSIPILLKTSSFEISLNEAAWSVSMMSLGATVSCIPAGVIRNKFGTKVLIAVYSIPSIIGWLFLIFPSSAWMVSFVGSICKLCHKKFKNYFLEIALCF